MHATKDLKSVLTATELSRYISTLSNALASDLSSPQPPSRDERWSSSQMAPRGGGDHAAIRLLTHAKGMQMAVSHDTSRAAVCPVLATQERRPKAMSQVGGRVSALRLYCRPHEVRTGQLQLLQAGGCCSAFTLVKTWQNRAHAAAGTANL